MSDTWSWTASIGYEQFVRDSCTYFSHSFSLLTTGYKFPGQFWTDASAVARNNRDPYMFLYLALFTIGWTMLRNAFTDYIVKPIGKRCELPVAVQEKLPECAWKWFYYTCSWSMAAYILLIKEKGHPLLHPSSIWQDWNFTRPLPFHYHLLYVGQLSFYLHSMHATLFMDRWRKDSIVLLYHHVVAVALIFFTFSARAHQAATITFFLHDICDIWLEGTKCLLYFKDQGKKTYVIFEYAANVGFIVFSVTWFAARLYAFPLRLVWICSTHLHTVGLVVPLMFMLNSLLYILLAMNVYWFTFIVKLLFKVATGGEELEDSREYDETESQPAVDNVAKQPNKSDPIDTVDMNAKKDNSDEPIRANHYILRKRSDIGIRSN